MFRRLEGGPRASGSRRRRSPLSGENSENRPITCPPRWRYFDTSGLFFIKGRESPGLLETVRGRERGPRVGQRSLWKLSGRSACGQAVDCRTGPGGFPSQCNVGTEKGVRSKCAPERDSQSVHTSLVGPSRPSLRSQRPRGSQHLGCFDPVKRANPLFRKSHLHWGSSHHSCLGNHTGGQELMNQMVRSVDAKARPPRFKSQFCSVLAVWPWVGYLTFLCL